MSYGSDKDVLERELKHTTAKPAVLCTKNGKVYFNTTPGDDDEILAATGVSELTTVTGSTLTVEDGGMYSWDVSELSAATITMTANHTDVSMVEAWITVGTSTAITLDSRITFKDPTASFSTGENHILIQLKDNTGKIYML